MPVANWRKIQAVKEISEVHIGDTAFYEVIPAGASMYGQEEMHFNVSPEDAMEITKISDISRGFGTAIPYQFNGPDKDMKLSNGLSATKTYVVGVSRFQVYEYTYEIRNFLGVTLRTETERAAVSAGDSVYALLVNDEGDDAKVHVENANRDAVKTWDSRDDYKEALKTPMLMNDVTADRRADNCIFFEPEVKTLLWKTHNGTDYATADVSRQEMAAAFAQAKGVIYEEADFRLTDMEEELIAEKGYSELPDSAAITYKSFWAKSQIIPNEFAIETWAYVQIWSEGDVQQFEEILCSAASVTGVTVNADTGKPVVNAILTTPTRLDSTCITYFSAAAADFEISDEYKKILGEEEFILGTGKGRENEISGNIDFSGRWDL